LPSNGCQLVAKCSHELEVELEVEVKEEVKYIVEIIDFLNNRCGTNYKSTTKKNRDLINARLKEGFTVKDFERVIIIKYREWVNNEDMCKFLRPSTLFGNNFESYLNQLESTVKEFKFDE